MADTNTDGSDQVPDHANLRLLGVLPMDELNELKSCVRQLPRGPVLEVVVVENLLMKCWDLLDVVYDDTLRRTY